MKVSHWYLGLFSVLVWSSVAAFIKKVSSNADPVHITYISILVGIFFTIFYSISLDSKIIKQSRERFIKEKKLWVQGLLSGIFLSLHYFSIYHLFSTEFVILGNIINYLWPILLYSLFILFSGSNGRSSPTDMVFLSMSFLGVALTLYSKSGYFDSNSIDSWILLGLSVLSAISAALYFYFSARIRTRIGGNALFFLVPLVLSFILSSPFFWYYNSFSDISINSFLSGFFLGFVSLSSANIAWVYATTKSDNPAFSSIAYFIPVISTILVLIVNGERIDHLITSGLALVFIANVFIHFRRKTIGEIKISLSLLLIFLSVSILSGSISQNTSTSFAEIAATIFALFSAFLLNRVWKKNEKESEILVETLSLLKSQLDKKNRELIKFNLEKAILEMHVSRTSELRKNYLQLVNTVDFHLKDSDEKKAILNKIRSWYLTKVPVINTPEFVMLLLMGFVSIIQILITRDQTILGDLSFTIFAATVTFIIYIIYEYDRFGILRSDNILSIAHEVGSLDEKNEVYIPQVLEDRFGNEVINRKTFYVIEGQKIYREKNRALYISTSRILGAILIVGLITVIIGLLMEKSPSIFGFTSY